MSYARFSSDDWLSDVYVYECENGDDQPSDWVTHVAGNRIQDDAVFRALLPPREPLPKPGDDVGALAYYGRYKLVMELQRAEPREYVDLPHAGDTLRDPTPGACADRLEYLRALGYRVPQGAVDRLRGEQEDLDRE